MSRRLVLAFAGLSFAVTLALVTRAVGEDGASPDAPSAPTRTVLVLTDPLDTGRPLAPDRVRVRVVPAALAPVGAFSSAAQAAFRVAAVDIPAGLSLVPSLFRSRGAVELGADDRAVGVQVDDVSGLPALLDTGSVVEVIVGPSGSTAGRTIPRAVVLARPRRGADGVSWSVALRLPAGLAELVGRAEASGADVRLLPRSGG